MSENLQQDPNELPCGLSYGWALPDQEELEEDLWLRWPANEILAVRVVSSQPIHYLGHWFPPSRTYRRCTAPQNLRLPNNCPFCPRPTSQGKPVAGPALWRHILALELPSGRQRIWEFSQAVAQQLGAITGYSRGEGQETRTLDLPGLRLLLHRQPPRLNGAVIVVLDETPEPRGDIPVEIDVAGYIAQTWARAAIKDGKAPPTLPGLG
jgi:hypothetical protein